MSQRSAYRKLQHGCMVGRFLTGEDYKAEAACATLILDCYCMRLNEVFNCAITCVFLIEDFFLNTSHECVIF